MKNKIEKMRINNTKVAICIFFWLLFSILLGYLFENKINIQMLNKFFFVKAGMVINQKLYYSTMCFTLLLSPFAFFYHYKYCIQFVHIERKHLWILFLGVFLGIVWNSGVVTIDTRMNSHYKYDLLFIYITQQLDWLGAVHISFIGIYMFILFSSLLSVCLLKKGKNTE